MKNLLMLAFVLSYGQITAAENPVLTKAIDATIKNEMEQQNLVGLAVGVVRDGKIAYLQAYGEADRAAKRPVTLDTVFNWASNSKPVAAVLAMQLVQEGKLDLDADVRKYVPEFPDKGAKITTRHLLCHQSGIPHYTNGKIIPTQRDYPDPKPFNDPVNGLDKFNQSTLIFQPGEKTAYSSHAYVLLSAVLQKAAGEPFMDLTKSRIAEPLKLKSFQWDAAEIQPDWATGYGKRNKTETYPVTDVAHDWKHAAGGFKTNVKDFARWAQALVNRELVDEAREKMMWTRQTLNDGSRSSWGLGFVLAERDGLLRVSHGGSQNETRTIMVIHPGEKSGVVILCNTSPAQLEPLADSILTKLK